MNKKYIYLILGIILAIIIALYIGKSIGQKGQQDVQTKDRIKVIQVENKTTLKKIDSLNDVIKDLSKVDKDLKKKENKTKQKADQIIITKPDNKACDDLYDKATAKISLLEQTIVIKDSVESNLRYQLRLKDNVIFNKDQLISNKDEEIGLLKKLNKPRNKKWAISIQVGTGGTVQSSKGAIDIRQAPVYVGVGISRNIISF